jgi:magnesium transporter
MNQIKARTLKNHLDEPALDHARSDFVHILEHHTVGEALAQVQQSQPRGRIVYFYAVDADGRLTGVVPTRRLLLNKPETPVAEIMVRRIVALPATATLLDACEVFITHRLLALPILDADRRMLGIVDVELYTDEISDLAYREESDDVFQLIGVRLAQIQKASVPVVFSKRFPWLLSTIAGGLAVAVMAGFFEDVLRQVVTLSLFMSLVLALAESVSIQSLTLTLQAQHGRRKPQWSEFARVFVREIPVGVLLGIGCAVLVALVAWLWRGEGLVAVCLLLSIAASMTTATLYGVLVPTVLRAVQGDPRIASGPITLALADLTTMLYYLGLATIMLR